MDSVDETSEIGPLEVESVVSRMAIHTLRDVGGTAWTKQHVAIHRLNVQAHNNVASRRDEYVVESFTSLDRLPVLVNDLLVAELWRERVLPELSSALDSSRTLVRPSLVLYHETVLVNMLELFLFSPDACASLGDSALDLAAYCHRRLLDSVSKEKSADRCPRELRDMRDKSSFVCQMAALSILRFLTDAPQRLPLGFASQVLETDDVLPVLVELLARHPWRKDGEVWEDGAWTKVAPPGGSDEGEKVCKPEAQLWLTLNNLMADPTFRAKSKWSSSRKESVLRAKRFLRDDIIDQIPVLADLKRSLEELTIFDAPPATSIPASVVIEHTATMRESILKAAQSPPGAWGELVKAQIAEMVPEKRVPEPGAAPPASPSPADSVIAEVAGALTSKATEDLVARPQCPVCGRPATKRCSRCKSEWYDSRECQVLDWTKHKTACEQIVEKLGKLS